MELPTISIITVTYNAEAYLEATLLSVIAQNYAHKEYIIIDGRSKDQTVNIIQKYAHHINYWVSEPDKGLYDAMNKGMAIAKGAYILFMNAGDTLYDPDTLRDIFLKNEQADIYYGEAEMLDAKSRQALGLRSEVTPHKLPSGLRWQHMQCGMVVCHQSFIVRKAIAPSYDLNYSYSADVDWVITCLKRSKKTIYTKQIIATFLQGGLSTQKR
ncbi:MAG: glycosyltransferase family 2 protein [Thermonemataceae bacterium]